MPQTTLGYEKLFNWALVEDDETRFVEVIIVGQPDPPAYFARMKSLNKSGPPRRAAMTYEPVPPGDIVAGLDNLGDLTVVDTRPAIEFAAEHPLGAINIPWNRSFLNWYGSLIADSATTILITHDDDGEKRSIIDDLSRIGMEGIVGIADTRDFARLGEDGAQLVSSRQLGAAELAAVKEGRTIVDVRRMDEWDSGHIPGAVNIPLSALSARMSELPVDRGVVVHCQGGSRAAIAASMLERHRRSGVAILAGGFDEWQRSGHQISREADEERGRS